MKPVAFIWSSVLHVVLLVAVIVGLPWRVERPPPAIAAAPIQGVIVDQAAIERERAKQEAAARQVRLQQQREDRQRREAAEQQRLAEQREQQRVAAAREDARRKEEERLAAERAEQQRKIQEAEAQARRDREEAEKRAAEQRRRQQAEAELQAQLAAEAEANAARAAGLLDQYMLMIENHVKRHWQAPLSARPGIECLVNVVQLPTGDVVSAKVGQCNGDEAVRRSIENAVLDASPLPRPPSQAVFSRSFTITFAPDK
jgi:colicin import membrane protein